MASGGKILAFDLGASNGRALLGQVNDSGISVDVLHRFPNEPVRTPDGLHWDALRLFAEMKQALHMCGERGEVPASMAVDTWGVDFAMLDEKNALVANPYHYRDSRNIGMMAKAFEIVPREEIYRRTGLQLMDINTVFQLLATVTYSPALLSATKTVVSIADLFGTWFCGRPVYEFSQASTTQAMDARSGKWDLDLLTKLGIPAQIMPEIVEPGTVLGTLLPYLQEESGLPAVPVVATCGHDTGSAVAAVPATGGDGWAYISSGTWSLVGIESKTPVITPESLAANFTNEGGAEHTFRVLKNVDGLWLLQECQRCWRKQGIDPSYEEIVAMAEQAEPLRSLIDVDADEFMAPPDMPAAINEWLEKTGQPIADSTAAMARCVMDSLALRHRAVVESLEGVTGKPIHTIHIVGGGSRNRLLCQFTADACGRRVVAGPAEATAIGNILVQAMALGRIGSLAEGRELVRKSSDLREYEPRPDARWDEAFGRLNEMAWQPAGR